MAGAFLPSPYGKSTRLKVSVTSGTGSDPGGMPMNRVMLAGALRSDDEGGAAWRPRATGLPSSGPLHSVKLNVRLKPNCRE
jgi:hypothetical protein